MSRFRILPLLVLAVALAWTGRTVLANPALKGYADYRVLKRQIDELAVSDVIAVSSLGKTLGGRDLYVLTVGVGETDAKPAILVVGNVHEPHLVGSELAIRIARRLAERYGEDEQIKALLQEYTFYMIPRPNPDGSERQWARPGRERAGNGRSTDDDRDFQVGEDPPNDLNDDGWITMIRVRDKTGPYMPHPDDARVMIAADAQKNERGSYQLYSEGKDDDKDEQLNEDAADGVSFNRNFTFRYPYFKPGAGPHQVSEKETRLVAEFAFDHPNIAVVFTFTPEDNLMRPWKPSSSSDSSRIKKHVLSADAPYFDFVAERYRKIHGGDDAPTSPKGAGSFSEWAYFHFGRWSLGASAWWPPKVPATNSVADEDKNNDEEGEANSVSSAGDKDAENRAAKKPADDKGGEEQLNALRWLDREGVDGFVDWMPIEHPDFEGKQVEVGGWKPFYRLNPPAQKLDELGDKHFQFLVELTELLPQVKIHTTKVASLGGGVYRITAGIINRGYLPTASEMGELSRRVYPLQIVIELPNRAEFIHGPARKRLDRLVGNGGSTEQTWIVRLPDRQPTTATLRVWAPAVGADVVTIDLIEKH